MFWWYGGVAKCNALSQVLLLINHEVLGLDDWIGINTEKQLP